MAKNELVTPLGDSAMGETNDALKVTLATALAGEDVTNDVTKVEQRGADCGLTPPFRHSFQRGLRVPALLRPADGLQARGSP